MSESKETKKPLKKGGLTKAQLKERLLDDRYIWELEPFSKDAEQMIHDIFTAPRPPQPRKVVIGRNCKTHGYIMDDGSVIDNYCSDPECWHCDQFHKLLSEEAKKFTDYVKPKGNKD